MKSALVAALGLALLQIADEAGAATGHSSVRAPADLLERVGFDQQLGARVPLDIAFRDAQGATVHLRELMLGTARRSWSRATTVARICATSFAPALLGPSQESGFLPGSSSTWY